MSFPNSELYHEIRAIAKRFMSRERRDHTLSPTDLFHEAYARLSPFLSAEVGSCVAGEAADRRNTLPSLFAITMRRVLIDHARKRARRRRRLARVGWIEPADANSYASQCEENHAVRLLDLDEALTRFALKYPLHAKIVELKYFGGLTVVECAEEVDLCPATTQRYWNFARAWIARELSRIELE